MYLWDTNILHAFIQGHPTLKAHLERTPWMQIALPTVVVAEVLRGRYDAALKAAAQDAAHIHQRLLETQELFQRFQRIAFDVSCGDIMARRPSAISAPGHSAVLSPRKSSPSAK